jgi:hypothetical protein
LLKDEVAKGQSGYINVSYDTKRQGPFTKTVTVMSNAGKSPTKVLTIKGVVKTQEQTEDQTPFMKPSGVSPLENGSSPFHFQQQRLALIEAPYMHSAMCFVPLGQPCPQIGDAIDVQRPLNSVAPDTTLWV